MIPGKIGKYTLIELLGRGGMGEVYLGEDPYIGRRVAIKVIKGADPEARDRFLHEARVIGGLTHPAIVSLLDFDFSGDEPFLVMEYLRGQGLDRWLRELHTLAEQLVVLEDLCEALAYAHQNGVLHRDVKPSNVQILANGHAKLMDFGIARGAMGKLTATGAVLGTPEYMAPEILNDASYSSRSDVYAFAVLLYEMFTGSNPFAAKTVAATLNNVLSLVPKDLGLVRPGFPPRLAGAIMECLRKDPDERPANFDGLLAAAKEATQAPSPGLLETRAIRTVSAPASADLQTRALGQAGSRQHHTLKFWLAASGAIAIIAFAANQMGRTVSPGVEQAAPAPIASTTAPIGDGASPVRDPVVIPQAAPEPTPVPPATPSPRSRAARPPSDPTPTPSRSQPAVVVPTATPSPSPTPAVALPTPTPSVPPVPVVTPTAPPPGQIVPEPTPPPLVSSVSPRTLRRGESVVLEVRGERLRADLTALILQGRRPASGIRVLRVEFVSASLLRVRVLSEPELPLGGYTLMLRDAGGGLIQGTQIEVVL